MIRWIKNIIYSLKWKLFIFCLKYSNSSVFKIHKIKNNTSHRKIDINKYYEGRQQFTGYIVKPVGERIDCYLNDNLYKCEIIKSGIHWKSLKPGMFTEFCLGYDDSHWKEIK